MADNNLPVPAWFKPEDILQRIIVGEKTKDLADSLGVKVETLTYYLTSREPESWKTAQLLRALRRKNESEDELDNATDAFTLAKAREKLKSAQWDLERVCSRIYGQQKPAEQPEPVFSINIDLRESGRTGMTIEQVK